MQKWFGAGAVYVKNRTVSSLSASLKKTVPACVNTQLTTPTLKRHLSVSPALSAAKTYFAESHEWIKVEEDNRTATFGVTDFAQKELGSIVYVDMPEPPHSVPANDSVAAIECGDGKAVGEVYTPQECEITDVNSALESDPGIINKDCFGDGWIVKVKFAEDFVKGKMMEEADYEKYLETCERHH